MITGLTRFAGKGHIARAALESTAYQTKDVLDAMTADSGVELTELRVDGGASVMQLLLQLQADQLGVPVTRPANTETTAVGAAYLAGLAEGVWASPTEVADAWSVDVTIKPGSDREGSNQAHQRWLAAVERSRHWAE